MQRFSEDEAQEILRRAVRAPQEGEYTSDELRRSAEELGISPEALARAEAEVREERTIKAFDRALQAQVKNEAIKFASIVTMLAAINLLTSREHLWFLYVFLFWGLAVAGSFFKARNRDSAGYQRAFERWQAKGGKVREGELAEIVRS